MFKTTDRSKGQTSSYLLRQWSYVRESREEHNITWKFNLSRARLWDGHFERLIGVVKKEMHKMIGGAALNWQELWI